MVDTVTSLQRSKIMSKVRHKNTKPELVVRSLLHKMGFRFRLNGSKYPGNPDLILKRFKTVIFVNGCFWHKHKNCKKL